MRPKTYEMAYRAIQEYIQFYNTERFQEKPHVLSPIGRQCEKDRVYTWMLHYYLEGFFMDKKVQHLIHTQMR